MSDEQQETREDKLKRLKAASLERWKAWLAKPVEVGDHAAYTQLRAKLAELHAVGLFEDEAEAASTILVTLVEVSTLCRVDPLPTMLTGLICAKTSETMFNTILQIEKAMLKGELDEWTKVVEEAEGTKEAT
jgi:hypothetical protein